MENDLLLSYVIYSYFILSYAYFYLYLFREEWNTRIAKEKVVLIQRATPVIAVKVKSVLEIQFQRQDHFLTALVAHLIVLKLKI